MRIADRYQSLMDRVGPGTARPADKSEKSNATGAARGAPPKKPANGNVEVTVSDRAQELAAGAAQLDALKASIQNGTYQINPQAIASRLIGEDF